MGNATSWLAQTLCPEEQVMWVAAKSGDHDTLRAAIAQLTPQTRLYMDWKDPLFGYSPLANACAQGHLHCVMVLLAAGADCNSRDVNGNTPLHIATKNGKSEIVRVLTETPRVDVFSKNTIKGETALDIARHEYKVAIDGGHRFIQCVEMIEKKLCIYSGWLYQRTDNLLSLASGLSSLNSWKKRYCMVLRTADLRVVEVDLFSMKPGEKRPPCPSLELVYRAMDGIQEGEDGSWFNRREFRFSLNAYIKSGINRVSAPQSFDFAATNQDELIAWKTFFTSLRVDAPPPPPLATAFTGEHNATRGSDTRNSAQAHLLQEQRDLERALQLSMEDARRNSAHITANSHISVPSAPMHSESIVDSPRAMIAPDGVEIVQPFGSPSGRPYASGSVYASPAPLGDGSGNATATGECIVCFDGPQAAVCVPCGHNAVCMDCAQELLQTTRLCPVCRVHVREFIKLYRV